GDGGGRDQGGAKGPRRGRGASGPRDHRTRHRKSGARKRRRDRALLRRRFPFGAGRRQPAKDGLHERPVNGRRDQGLAGGGGSARIKSKGQNWFICHISYGIWNIAYEPDLGAKFHPRAQKIVTFTDRYFLGFWRKS